MSLQTPSTPKGAPSSLPTDTPAVKKSINSAHPDLNTDGMRQLAMKDLQEIIPQVPKPSFFKKGGLLPPLPEGVKMGKILKTLQGGAGHPLGPGGKWKGFGEKSDFVGITEDTLFASLPRIIERIVDASGLDKSKRTLVFECNPTGVPTSFTRNNDAKPDCVGRLATATAKYSEREWIDVAVPGEFKRLDNNVNAMNDYAKVLWSGQHILREDPRRRFAYGFTIEGWNMRMWYMNRSDVFVSWVMNINDCHKEFVEFFLRLTFADTYQLGWDPTIRRRPLTGPHSSICYDIDLNGKTYRTLNMLSNVGAEALRGRGTRVWEVKELGKDGEEDPNAPVLVLKDSWVDRERVREGEILKKILEDARKTNESLARVAEATLVKAKTWGDVEYNGKRDDTFTEKQREKVLQAIDGEVAVKVDALRRRARVVSHLPAVGALPPPQKQARAAIRYSPKVHHRIIFTEVGQRLTDLKSLSRVFHCLAQVLLGLQAIHACGWVHRDISIGNILVINGKIGKITDVEYAKPEDAPTHSGFRTGTEYFMSPEVEYRTYAYTDKSHSVSQPQLQSENKEGPGGVYDSFLDYYERILDAPPSEQDASRDTRESETPPAEAPPETDDNMKEDPPFRNNPLHDIESVFWVALWVLLCSTYRRVDESISQEDWNAYMKTHENTASEFFCDPRIRERVMRIGPPEFNNRFSKVLPRLRSIGTELDKFRHILIQAYENAEHDLKKKNYIIPFDVAIPIYKELTEILYNISTQLSKNDLTIDIKDSNTSLKVVKRAPKPDTVAAASGSKSSSKARPAPHADHDETARPAKSQKTTLASRAGTGATRALPTRTMQTRSKAKTLPKRGGKPGGSGRR